MVEDISNETRKGSKPKEGATLLLKLVSLKDGDEKTETLVAKQVPSTGLSLSRNLGLAREAMFYNLLAPKIGIPSSNKNSADDPMRSDTSEGLPASFIPKIHYASGDMRDGSKIVVMEDLSEDYVDSGILFGPGNPNNWKRKLNEKIAEAYPSIVPTSFDVANQTFIAIANVHAAFWRDKELLKEAYCWLRGSPWICGNNETSWRASQGILQTTWKKYLTDPNNDSNEHILWDPLVWSIVEKAIKGISWEMQKKRLNEQSHFCLVHGDFWPGNIMVSKEVILAGTKGCQSKTKEHSNIRDLQLLDWEMVGLGSGPQELGQYILSNMKPSERRECEEQLVRNYHNKLIELGITGLSWNECWSEYKIGGLERWIWFLVYFCGQPGPLMTKWAQFFHDQITEFVHDHGISPEDVTQPRP